MAMIPSEDERAALAADDDFARDVVRELVQCHRYVIKAQKDLKLCRSLEPLANFLLRQQKRAGGEVSFDLPSDKRRLASFLGMKQENLSQAFKSLQDHGVTVQGARVTINDRANLESLAKPRSPHEGAAT